MLAREFPVLWQEICMTRPGKNRSERGLNAGWGTALLPLIAGTVLQGCIVSINIADNQSMPLIPGDGVVALAAGDIADCRKLTPAHTGAAQTAAMISAELAGNDKAVILTLGDHTYPNGRLAEFTDCYAPTWGRFKDRTFPSPGNHEYYTKGATGYYEYFGNAAGPDRRGYYSVKLGSWHIVSLNSNLKNSLEHHAQLEWLKAELAQHKTRCTLAYWHHPVFSSGGHGDNPHMQDAWKILADAGADVVLVAHDHDYERFVPMNADGKPDGARGIRQFVVGTGGAALTPFRFRRPNSEGGSNATHGVLKLVLKETGYEWEFLPTVQGSFKDRGASLCN
jgi:hypothetical protein